MKRVFAVLAFLLPIVAAADGPQRAPTRLPKAEVVRAQIESEGAAAVLNQLWKSETQFDALCRAIATGKAEWLEIARKLRRVSDAGVSMSLDISVAEALPNAPERVLAMLGSEFTVESICSIPFIEPLPGEVTKYRKRANAALNKVTEPSLQPIRARCLAELNKYSDLRGIGPTKR